MLVGRQEGLDVGQTRRCSAVSDEQARSKDGCRRGEVYQDAVSTGHDGSQVGYVGVSKAAAAVTQWAVDQLADETSIEGEASRQGQDLPVALDEVDSIRSARRVDDVKPVVAGQPCGEAGLSRTVTALQEDRSMGGDITELHDQSSVSNDRTSQTRA